MARRSHYERAFAAYLARCGASFAFLNDAKRVVAGDPTRLVPPCDPAHETPGATAGRRTLKNFDLVLYADRVHAIVDVKGRKVASKLTGERTPRLENWVTGDDIESLRVWEALFGEGYEAAFVFVYWCPGRPPARLFDDRFEHHGRWYGLRGVSLSDYRAAMKPRSQRWRTVHLDQADFERVSRPVFGAGELYSGEAPSYCRADEDPPTHAVCRSRPRCREPGAGAERAAAAGRP